MIITREFGFDMGHMLPDHLGGCYRPHGHRYRLDVALDDDLHQSGPANGMVMDYADLKRIVTEVIIDTFDHRFVVAASDHRLGGMRQVFTGDELIVVERPPTAENLVTSFAGLLTEHSLPVSMLRLWETPSCSAVWTRP